MRLLKTLSHVLLVWCALSFASFTAYAQAPNISYSPASSPASPIVLTAATPMTSMTPANSGGAVATLSYGAGTTIPGGGLDHPYGVATDAAGNVYVANFGVDKKDVGSISKYNVTTHAWSTFATDSVFNPTAIAIDNSGNVFVLNYQRGNNGNGNQDGNAYVTEYNSSGVLMATIVSGLSTANGIAINNSNGNLDIAEGSYSSGNQQIAEYNISGGLNFTINNTTVIPNPVNVATDNAGNIYVLDNTNKDVVKFSSTGTYISTPVNTGLVNPFGLYVDGSGNIYVSDSGAGGTNSIKVYNSSGTSLTTLNSLADPEGMTTDYKGTLYVTDYTNQTLTQYNATGGYFISGKLPAGLNFDYTTGTISGTPVSAFATTTYTITAYNASGSSNTTVTLKCNANAALPTITYNPFSVNVYTTGSPITTLVPTTTNGPTSFSISGTLPAGLNFNPGTGRISGTPTAVQAASLYTVTATNGTGSGTTTISIATVIADYWIGKTSVDWNTGSNWSTGSPPTTTGYASIGEQAYTGKKLEPTISGTEAITVGYLTFGATHVPTLTVTNGATGGTLTVNNILTIDDNATPTITGTGKVNMSPTSVVNVAGAGVLTVNTGLTFTLQSNATSSAAVDQITSGAINGQVSVQRYLSAQRGYRLLASPVNFSGVANANGNLTYSLNYVKNSAYITGTTLAAGGFDVSSTVTTTSENPTLYVYREDLPVNNSSFISGNYRGVSNITTAPTYSLNNEASTYTLPVSNGFLFFFRGNRASATFDAETQTSFPATTATLTATGFLNQGQVVFRNWYTPASPILEYSNLNVSVKGFNLVANPYACTIDLDTYNTTSTTSGIYAFNVSQFIYELNPRTKNYDTYQANSAGMTYTNSGGRYIASGQGFFVQANNTNAQLIFNETAKFAVQQVTGTSLFMGLKAPLVAKHAKVVKPLPFIRLQMALDTVNTDDILLLFDNNANPDYVFGEDAPAKQGAGKVNLSSIASNRLLAINKLPLHDGIAIPLKAGFTAFDTYTLNLKDVENVPQLYDIWLKDAFTKDSVNMRTTPSYPFSITKDTSSYGTKRFTLIMKQNPSYAYQLLTFNAVKTDNNTHTVISWTTKYEGDYTNFTVERSNDDWKTITEVGNMTSSGAGSYIVTDISPMPGSNLYRLKQVDINNNITYSNQVNVQFDVAGNSNINVYPNPAGSTFNLSFVPKSEGNKNYKLNITNSAGVVVRSAHIAGTNWQDNISGLLPGTYLVTITSSSNNQLVGQTKFVKL